MRLFGPRRADATQRDRRPKTSSPAAPNDPLRFVRPDIDWRWIKAAYPHATFGADSSRFIAVLHWLLQHTCPR
jgi:hypothetical protein